MASRGRVLVALCAALCSAAFAQTTSPSPVVGQTTGCYAAAACGQDVAYSTSLYKLFNNTWVLVYPCQCTDGRQLVVNEQGEEVMKVTSGSSNTTTDTAATNTTANTTTATTTPAATAPPPPPPPPATTTPAATAPPPPPPPPATTTPGADATTNATANSTAVVKFNYVINANGTATYQTWDLASWIETLVILTGGVDNTPCKKVNTSALVNMNVDACRSNVYSVGTMCTEDCHNLVSAMGANCAASLNKKVPGFFNFPDPESQGTTLVYAIQQCITYVPFTEKPNNAPAPAPAAALSRKFTL